tara:strand:- start:1386 stop:1823 length:438 start_codon:yes stop_codon:yes gene_type:complete
LTKSTTKLKVKARKSWSIPERHLAREAIDFAMNELDLVIAPIPITVYLKGAHAQDFGDSIDLGHKVIIRINKTVNWLRTLFHEMEHARQYIYCELELEIDHAMWQDELIKRDIDNWDEYWNAPWEVAARKKEVELFAAFQKNLLT